MEGADGTPAPSSAVRGVAPCGEAKLADSVVPARAALDLPDPLGDALRAAGFLELIDGETLATLKKQARPHTTGSGGATGPDEKGQ